MKRFLASVVYSLLFGKPKSIDRQPVPDLTKVRRILIVRDDHIGDLICSTPVFEALKKTCPQAEITLVSSTYNGAIAEGNPYIDRILCYEKYKHRRNGWRLGHTWCQYRFFRSLRREAFDLAIGLRSHFSRRQAQIVFASGAPYRLGHQPQRSRYRHLSFFFNLIVPESRARKHEVERSLDVLKVIGIELPQPKPLVVINQSEKDFASQVIRDKEIKGDPIIGYHISNRNVNQHWPISSFAQLIKLLKREYPHSEHIITFAPNDQERARQLAARIGSRGHLVRTPGIKQLGALQRCCQLFITLDGAPLHLSAALGIPTLAIFGFFSDPGVWHPWGFGHRWLKRNEESVLTRPEEVFNVASGMLSKSDQENA